jgi:hypothetical protein
LEHIPSLCPAMPAPCSKQHTVCLALPAEHCIWASWRSILSVLHKLDVCAVWLHRTAWSCTHSTGELIHQAHSSCIQLPSRTAAFFTAGQQLLQRAIKAAMQTSTAAVADTAAETNTCKHPSSSSALCCLASHHCLEPYSQRG